MSIYLNSLCVARNKMLVLYVSINNNNKERRKRSSCMECILDPKLGLLKCRIELLA